MVIKITSKLNMIFKLFSILAISLVLSSIAAPQAFAHLAGQPPFFKINGKYSNLYPVPTTSLEDLNLPQDLASESYLVGTSLSFEFDTSQLPVSPQALAATKFFWDFGDGSKGEGLKNTHTYSKIGSYFILINAQYQKEQTQIIQSVLLNIVPSKDFQLPQAIIKINGQKSKDPLTDILKFDFQNPIQFDATESKSSTQITSYTWDFGDRQSSSNATVSHSYDTKQIQVFPVLRIKDSNGFIADNFLELENKKLTDQPDNNTQASSTPQSVQQPKTDFLDKLKIPAAIVLGLILLGVILYIKKRR
jgi:hypothetical protein